MPRLEALGFPQYPHSAEWVATAEKKKKKKKRQIAGVNSPSLGGLRINPSAGVFGGPNRNGLGAAVFVSPRPDVVRDVRLFANLRAWLGKSDGTPRRPEEPRAVKQGPNPSARPWFLESTGGGGEGGGGGGAGGGGGGGGGG